MLYRRLKSQVLSVYDDFFCRRSILHFYDDVVHENPTSREILMLPRLVIISSVKRKSKLILLHIKKTKSKCFLAKHIGKEVSCNLMIRKSHPNLSFFVRHTWMRFSRNLTVLQIIAYTFYIIPPYSVLVTPPVYP